MIVSRSERTLKRIASQAKGYHQGLLPCPIATDSGLVKPMGFRGIGKLCEKLNTGDGITGLVIEPPHRDGGDEPLYRVVYVIDANEASPLEAARQVHQIMMDMIRHDSQPPVLEILDHRGTVVSIDLSE